jgi:hypothetical protein
MMRAGVAYVIGHLNQKWYGDGTVLGYPVSCLDQIVRTCRALDLFERLAELVG